MKVTTKYNRISNKKLPTQNAGTERPATICWYFARSAFYFTIKDATDIHLKAKEIEKIMAPKKPEIVLFIRFCFSVIGNGLFTGVKVICSEINELMYASTMMFCVVIEEIGVFVFIIDVNGMIVYELKVRGGAR